jgi:TetR/AcrR family fatty acid metabolism transcriptional regulator
VRTKTPLQADKMLDAAGRLFGAHRFHEVRMEDIAAEAGVGKGTLYRYFHDKEELYLALLERSSRQMMSRLCEETSKAEGGRERLVALVAAILDFFDTHPHLLDLIQRAEVLRDPRHPFPWQKARDEVLHLVLDLFEDARRRGDFRVEEPELMVMMLLGGLRSVIRFGKKPRPRDLAERIVETFLHGADVSAADCPSSPRKASLRTTPAPV